MNRNSFKAQSTHSNDDSFDAYADFTDHSKVCGGNHGFGPSVQLHLDRNSFASSMTGTPTFDGALILAPDALPTEKLPKHFLSKSDTVDSLDPDLILEAAYFANTEVYTMDPSDTASFPDLSPMMLPALEPKGKSLPLSDQISNILDPVDIEKTSKMKPIVDEIEPTDKFDDLSIDTYSQSALSPQLQETDAFIVRKGASRDSREKANGHSKAYSKGITNANERRTESATGYGAGSGSKGGTTTTTTSSSNGGTDSSNWTMPLPSMDHSAAMRQDSAYSVFSVGNMTRNGMVTQRVASPESVTGASVSGHNKGVSIVVTQWGGPQDKNTSKSAQRSACPSPTRSYRGSRLLSAEQFEVWQMQGRTLRNMSHCDLLRWLEDSGFTEEVTAHFRKYRIDGRKLWSNLRNASMFLYNVGVVRPTLRGLS